MKNMQPYRINTISQYHQIMGLPKPEHPLVSIINLDSITYVPVNEPMSVIFDFYSISLKRDLSGQMKFSYGQQSYDFNEGTMFFMSPGQVFSIEANQEVKQSGWMLLIHPDFLWNTHLAKTIKQYGYFDYSVNEALHLSEKEEIAIISIMQNISQEYHTNIDNFSQDLIIAQLELFLIYCDRFYNRQFITRKIENHKILDRLEEILREYFDSDAIKKGLPTVQYIANKLNISTTYLTSMLRVLTGQNTQQHIHDKLIAKAKEKLSTTDLSVSEIAYELGFEHSQSFNKLFKSKTNISPLEFRRSFH